LLCGFGLFSSISIGASNVFLGMLTIVFLCRLLLKHDDWKDVLPSGRIRTAFLALMGAVLLSETPPTVPQIAEKMGITRQGALKQVNVLIEEGLLTAQPNPAHQRAQLYVLTEKGKQAARQIQAHWRAHAEKIAEQFHPDDLAAAARVLGQLGQFYQDK